MYTTTNAIMAKTDFFTSDRKAAPASGVGRVRGAVNVADISGVLNKDSDIRYRKPENFFEKQTGIDNVK